MPGRLPWEIVETFPSTDKSLLTEWTDKVDAATTPNGRARALIGHALASYWAVAEGVTDFTWSEATEARKADLAEALAIARCIESPDLLAEALLGVLYATWGPDSLTNRTEIVEELTAMRDQISDEELRLRILEWVVLGHLDHADLDNAAIAIEHFADESADTEMVLFRRREILWRACIAMLDGRIDESLQANQDAISSTANTAGSPFSFQNVAITIAIERYLRRGLNDVVISIRSIRASSPRVATNWDTGLAFALSEVGEDHEAAELFSMLTKENCAAVPRDLNWLVTMQLLGLIALNLDEQQAGQGVLEQLLPYAELDATHGSGYASYGPVGRVVASLAAQGGDQDLAERCFDQVLSTRAAGPWTSLTLLNRATARRGTNPTGALEDATIAAAQLGELGLEGWAAEASSLIEELRLAGHADPIARLDNQKWTLRHPTGSAEVNSGVGIDHLVQLLAHPGQSFKVSELDATVDPALPSEATAERSLDRTARISYLQRVGEIEALATATPQDQEELLFLKRELAGSAYFVSVSTEAERTRVRVTKALRRAIDDIANHSAPLGQHLRSTIETGRKCLYHPASGAAWLVTRSNPNS